MKDKLAEESVEPALRDFRDDTTDKTNDASSARIAAAGFGADGKVEGSSDDPKSHRASTATKQLYEKMDDTDAKSFGAFDLDKSVKMADYKTFLDEDRVYVAWHEPYRNLWIPVAKLPIEGGLGKELQRLFNLGPMVSYVNNVCLRRTHHLLYFKEHGHGMFAYERLKCIVWQKLSRIVRPGAAINFYRTAVKRLFMDAYRDGGRSIRTRSRYSEKPSSPEVPGSAVLVKQEPSQEVPHGEVPWTGT